MSTTLIQLRRGTAAAWTAENPVLAEGELGVESDTHRIKAGDGATAWTGLPYAAGGTGGGGGGSVAAASETVAGVLEIATDTETTTGTDDARAVTPLKMAHRLRAYLARAATRATSDADPLVATVAATISVSLQNVWENYGPGPAGSSVLVSWLNEWGALRGTSPYTTGDPLVQGRRASGDGITGGHVVELLDASGATAVTRWGRRWVDGSLTRNGKQVREMYVWRTGDADPTAGGTVALPANAHWTIVLDTIGGTVPPWTPVGSVIVEPTA